MKDDTSHEMKNGNFPHPLCSRPAASHDKKKKSPDVNPVHKKHTTQREKEQLKSTASSLAVE